MLLDKWDIIRLLDNCYVGQLLRTLENTPFFGKCPTKFYIPYFWISYPTFVKGVVHYDRKKKNEQNS